MNEQTLTLVDRIKVYFDDGPPNNGSHSDAAGANAFELLQEAETALRASQVSKEGLAKNIGTAVKSALEKGGDYLAIYQAILASLPFSSPHLLARACQFVADSGCDEDDTAVNLERDGLVTTRSQHQQMRDAINDVELALNGLEIDSVVRRWEGAADSVMVKLPLGALRQLARSYPELNRIINDPAFERRAPSLLYDDLSGATK